MSDYTPTDGEVLTAVVLYRAIASDDAPPPTIETIATPEETARYLGEYQRWLAEHDAKVRAEECEKADRELSDAEVEAAADAIVEASFGQELPEAPIDLARAALLAAQAVRRG